MVRLEVNQFNIFLRLLEDETERYKLWIETEDFASKDELKSLKEELTNLLSTLDELKLKKQRLLALLRWLWILKTLDYLFGCYLMVV